MLGDATRLRRQSEPVEVLVGKDAAYGEAFA
jgi:hypothetical protein